MLKGHLPPPESLRALIASRLADLHGDGSPTLAEARRSAAADFERLGLPGPRAEAWKYTPLPTLLPKELGPATRVGQLAASDLERHLSFAEDVPRLVFVNGHFDQSLSALPSAETGIVVRPLATTCGEKPADVVAQLGAVDGERSLSALNSALVEDGCIIDVGADATERRLLLVSVLTGEEGRPQFVNTRYDVRVAAEAEFEIGEIDLLLSAREDVVNRVVNVSVGEGARLRQERIQVGGSSARVLAHLQATLAADSRLTHGVAILGGALARNEIAAELAGTGIEATFNGLSLIEGRQHVDHALTIRHMAPGSLSDQFYKSVLDDRARAAFAGKIVVDRAAQKTNAYQSNNNLLLSADAEANAKPELEIYADDVKCSHGATVGELDERELFYLRSRGLDVPSARALLTFAFLGEVLERFEGSLVESIVRQELLHRIGTDLDLEGLIK